jgi:hypothetical protein
VKEEEKKQEEPKPLTARPLGKNYFVMERGKEGKMLGQMVSNNEIVESPGCYQRMPTCKE